MWLLTQAVDEDGAVEESGATRVALLPPDDCSPTPPPLLLLLPTTTALLELETRLPESTEEAAPPATDVDATALPRLPVVGEDEEVAAEAAAATAAVAAA